MRSSFRLFSDSWSLVKQNMFLYVGILVVPMLLSYAAGLFMPSQNTAIASTAEWLIYLVLLVVSVLASILMTIAFTLALDNPSLQIGQAYRASLGLFWSYLGLSIVMSLILLAGFLLLIIPGIIMSVWFSFATFVLILERSSIKDSLKRSREYVRGRWWGVFGRLIIMSIVAFVFGAIFGIVASMIPNPALSELVVTLFSLIIMPILIGYIYLMYKDVKSSGSAAV
jgi:hypothetical protein